MCFSKKCQKIRLHDLCACGTIVRQALLELLDSFLRPSLLCEPPAAQARTCRPPLRKPLFCREANGSFGTLLGGTSLVAELVEYGSGIQAPTQAKGVRNLVREDHELFT